MGLTGNQGVMIPSRNLPHLMLRKDVVAAVKAGRFHIYSVSTVEEGLETLTGVVAGEPQQDGAYPADTIFGRVDVELRRLAEQVTRYITARREIPEG
jgi:predicted ATP-dependent protease